MRRRSQNPFDVSSFSDQLQTDLIQFLPPEARNQAQGAGNRFEKYQCDPCAYAREILRLTPWAGYDGHPGQAEIFADIGASVAAQLAGDVNAAKTFRVEAGHGVGKTHGAAMLVNWFFDCFQPSICMTTAPTKNQVVDLLWKNIKTMRPGGLGGRVLPSEPRMERAPNHWAVGRTTSDAGGKGTERFHGQHDDFLFFVLDEAEGVAAFVFDAIRAMMTGGRVIICLMCANPRTRASKFFKIGRESGVKNYRLSVLNHPNVVEGRPVISGATTREWVIKAVQDWCEVAPGDDPDNYTFQLPFDIPPSEQGAHGPAGTWFLPDSEFLFRVMGVAPANLADKTFVPSGRYEAACKRNPDPDPLAPIRMGADVARYGSDSGTIYVRQGLRCWRVAKLSKQDTTQYVGEIKTELLRLAALGEAALDRSDQSNWPDGKRPKLSARLRIDAGGGFGGGVADQVKNDAELRELFPDWEVVEVDFGGTPHDVAAYYDQVTQLYASTGEALKNLAIIRAPEELESDLTERLYGWAQRAEVAVRRLEPKDKFRERLSRSPDDGDGFVLAVPPDFCFEGKGWGRSRDALEYLANR